MTRIPRVLVCVTGQKSCEHLIHVGAEIAREDGAELSYSDAAQIADYARQPVTLLTGLGILSGSGDGMLHPKSNLTREQAIKLAVELLAKLTK